MKTKQLPSKSRLDEVLKYNKKTGQLTWKQDVASNARKGGVITSQFSNGYLRVSVGGERYSAHRIIWRMMNGEFDESLCIDHINGDRTDNRIVNLRLVTPSENRMNAKTYSHNTSGFRGVTRHSKFDGWVSQIKVSGKNKYLGLFRNINDAIKCRLDAEKLYGFHSNHGRV